MLTELFVNHLPGSLLASANVQSRASRKIAKSVCYSCPSEWLGQSKDSIGSWRLHRGGVSDNFTIGNGNGAGNTVRQVVIVRHHKNGLATID